MPSIARPSLLVAVSLFGLLPVAVAQRAPDARSALANRAVFLDQDAVVRWTDNRQG